MHKPPSTAWREVVKPDEDRRFATYAEAMVGIQRARNAKFGTGRAVHRKQHVGLSGTLEVFDELPAHARHGLFARPGTYDTWVRLSNGGADVAKDKVADIRGFAIKVLGVSGPSALSGTTDAQDFALIHREAFGFVDSAAFVALVLEITKSPFHAAKHVIGKHGLVGGFRELARLQRELAVPFTGFATEHFYSAAPIACGPYAARVRLKPHAAANDAKQPASLAKDMIDRLRAGPVVYDLELQFFVDEVSTPIEDATHAWPQDETPYLRVGRLVLSVQDAESTEGQALAAQTEQAKFDPWCALAEHRPLGDVMRARKVVYYASQTERGAR